MVAGLAFMAYPYFATTVLSLILVGAGRGVWLWFAVRFDW
jgi:hypothetical protein